MSQQNWNDEMWDTIQMTDGTNRLNRLKRALNQGADVKKLSNGGTSPLAYLMTEEHSVNDMVRSIVKSGAKTKNTAEEIIIFNLYIKYYFQRPTLLKYLLFHRVFESLTIYDFTNALHEIAAICQENSLGVMQVCIGHMIKVRMDVRQVISHKDHNGDSIIHNVVNGTGADRRPAMIQQLIRWGANVLQQDIKGDTPEQCAKNDGLCPQVLMPGQHYLITILEEKRHNIEEIARERRQAFSMAWHERLGRDSNVNGIDPDLIDIIWNA
jgi:hypothetical protein